MTQRQDEHARQQETSTGRPPSRGEVSQSQRAAEDERINEVIATPADTDAAPDVPPPVPGVPVAGASDEVERAEDIAPGRELADEIDHAGLEESFPGEDAARNTRGPMAGEPGLPHISRRGGSAP